MNITDEERRAQTIAAQKEELTEVIQRLDELAGQAGRVQCGARSFQRWPQFRLNGICLDEQAILALRDHYQARLDAMDEESGVLC